jgi:uncharacterized membrane protein YgdD (TMEM256/DUF423 family)|tara:strand:+ start:1110 stop:1496 length:387 start_codon:yes stop_codon:yes gene_type:complete
MERKIILLASLTGGLAVILGAFAAHGLKPLLSDSAMDSLGTGIRYQMYHAFLLFYIASTTRLTSKQQSLLYKLILIGILLFSGSIYLLSTNELTTFDFKAIGFVTPLGGVFLISVWALLFVYNLRNKS